MKNSIKFVRVAAVLMILAAAFFNMSLKPQKGITICHCKGQDEAYVSCSIELNVPQKTAEKHLAHGDLPGRCSR